MIGPLRSELLKLRTTRTTLGLLLGAMGLVGLTTVVPLVLADTEAAPDLSLYDEGTQRAIFLAPAAATLFASFVGLLSFTSEFRHGTIRPTFVLVPGRTQVVAAKLVAAMLAGAFVGVAAVAVTYGLAIPWIDAKGFTLWLGREELIEIAVGVVGACVLWAAIGLGIGAVARNQVGAIVAVIVWSVVESILGGVVPRVARFGPGQAGDALSGSTDRDLLAPLGGLAVLAVWAVAFTIAGVLSTSRRDVP